MALTIALLVLPTGAFAQASPADAVATVNGHPITRTEYYHRMEFLGDMGTLVGTQYVQVPPGLMTLDDLITEQLVLQLAAKKGVSPTDAQTDALMRDALAANPMLEKNWIASGRTEDELKNSFRLQAARYNILTAGVIVTDTEVEKQYSSNPNLYTVPKRVDLKVIVVGSQDDEAKVDSALQSGTSFSDAAKQFSQDLSKDSGGEFGLLPLSSLPKYIQDGLQGVKIGQVTPWLTGSDGSRPLYMKALFVNAVPEEKLPLDDSLKASIRKNLMISRGSKLNNVSQELEDLRKDSKIEIENPVLSKDYSNIVNKLNGSSSKGS